MSELKLEAEKLKYANDINDLLVKFIRTDTINGINVLVTERHYPMQSRAFDYQQRLDFMRAFKVRLMELHAHGFAHGDLDFPILFNAEYARGYMDRTYCQSENVILTQQGVVLIDTGRSALKEDVCEQRFNEVKQYDFHGLLEIEHVLKQNGHSVANQVIESDYIVVEDCLMDKNSFLNVQAGKEH